MIFLAAIEVGEIIAKFDISGRIWPTCIRIYKLARTPNIKYGTSDKGQTVCVCSCPPVMGGVTVKHALTSTSSPPNDILSIPWSPVVLPLRTPLGSLLEGFPTDPCISDVGLRGSCCWAIPQPRNLALQVVNARSYTQEQVRREGQRVAWRLGQS